MASAELHVRLAAAASGLASRARSLREGLAELSRPLQGFDSLKATAAVAELAQRIEVSNALGALPLVARARLLRVGCACLAHVALLTDEDVRGLALDNEAETLVREAVAYAGQVLLTVSTPDLVCLPVMGVVRTALQRLACFDSDHPEVECQIQEELSLHANAGEALTGLGPVFCFTADQERTAMSESVINGCGKIEVTPPQLPRRQRCSSLVKFREDDFNQVGVLGAGSFGIVTLERHLPSGSIFALKYVSKGLVVEKGMEEKTMNERNMLAAAAECTFVTRLLGTINSQMHLVYVLEPCLGGELNQVYKRYKLVGAQRHTRFYVACVLRALSFLADHSIIYRDVKPENVLVSSSGYAKLADFGLAKRVNGLTYTTCGSIAYFAPEVIAQKGYGLAVDWWALGVLVYELTIGHTPFEGNDVVQTYRKIIKGIDEVTFPRSAFTPDVEGIVRTLCTSDPHKRPPACPGGVGKLMNHSYFTGMRWEDLDAQSMEPPFVPCLSGDEDLSNFTIPTDDDLPVEYPYRDPGTGWDANF